MNKQFVADLSKLTGPTTEPADAYPNGQGTYSLINGMYISSQEIHYETERQLRAYRAEQFRTDTLRACDLSIHSASQYALNIVSNVRDGLAMGIDQKDVMYMLNELFVVIDERLATKDEHGRNDFAPGEYERKQEARRG